MGDGATGSSYHSIGMTDLAGLDDTLVFRARNADVRANTANIITVDAWNHGLAIARATDDREVMLNGDTANTGTSTVNSADNTFDTIAVGMNRDSTPSDPYDGTAAEVAVWDGALTLAEGVALANGVSPLRIRPGNLKAYYPLFGVALPEPDYIGILNLTDTGGTSQHDHAPVMPPFGFALGWPGNAAAGAPAGLPFPPLLMRQPIITVRV